MLPSRSRTPATREPCGDVNVGVDTGAGGGGAGAPAASADVGRADHEAALVRLQEAVTALVLAAEARMGERCPYRDAADVCTFTGGCQNQRREVASHAASPLAVRCGGDGHLKWIP